jgi:hypothetical protein
MKKFRYGLLAAAGLLLITGGIAGGCGWAGFKLVSGVLDNRTDLVERYYPGVARCGKGIPLTAKLKQILNGTYIVLLQNNNELRATGGFAGSYAKLKFEKGGLQSVTVQDIYEPDGKLPGHVEPPYPIQEAFGQGWWKLRDANWDADFASAAATVDWFMRQGGEETAAGIAAVNLDLMEKWVAVFGEVEVTTYGVKVTKENLYALAQTYAETRTEGEKTQKRGFLGALGTALMERTRAAGWQEMVKIGKVIWEELKKGQVLVWVKDPEVQAELRKLGWTGNLTGSWAGAGDLVYVVDTNLGANKSDCCIVRQLQQEVEGNGEKQRVRLTISRQNNNPYESPKPPFSFGGRYVDYVRVIIPSGATELKRVTVKGKELREMAETETPNSLRQGRSEDEYATEIRGEVRSIGFWLVVEAGETGTAEVEWESGRMRGNEYEVLVRRQPGVESFWYGLTVNGRMQAETELDRDREFRVRW